MEQYSYTKSDKLIVKQRCIDFIKDNGYVRVGYILDQHLKDKNFGVMGDRISFINSVSSMLINTGEYIREKHKDIEGDFDILLNPNYFLNKSVKTISIVTTIIAFIALLVSGIGLWQQLTDNNQELLEQLKETNSILQKQEILIDSLVQNQKNIDYSIRSLGLSDSEKK